MPTAHFILAAVDPAIGCDAFETRFEAEAAKLRALLDIDPKDDPDFEAFYPLDEASLQRICDAFAVPFDANGLGVWLRRCRGKPKWPYLSHTGFELFLVLDGRKPLARFTEEYPACWHNPQIDCFAPYVAEGLFIERIVDEPFPEPHLGRDGRKVEGVRTFYFAARGEEWRIDAAILLTQTVRKSKWNETFERPEGSLLGYKDWENDWWIENRYRPCERQARKFRAGLRQVRKARAKRRHARIAAAGRNGGSPSESGTGA
jgi:hypothetical protein